MGTRSAPLVFLLLAACMATDGTQTATRDDAGPAPAATATSPVTLPADLPAIPRMRPGAPGGKKPAATADAQPGMTPANANGRRGGAATGPTASGQPGAAQPGEPGASTADPGSADGADARDTGSGRPQVLSADGSPSTTGDPAAGRAEAALPSGTDASAGASGATSSSWPPQAESAAGWPSGDDGGGGSHESPGTRVAVAPPLADTGIDVESLFDGDVVRYCAAMWQMGEYIGAARRRGEPFKKAIGDAVRRIAAEEQLPLDNRLAFSGQVYGRLLYRLDEDHASLTLGAYVHFACLTVRGDKKIVPADPNAERLLNAGLAHCENVAFTRDKLNDCIFRELTPIIDRRNG